MNDWIYLAVYVAGFLATCRLLARYAFDPETEGLLIIGMVAVFWPLLAIATAIATAFAALVWLATWGLRGPHRGAG